MIWRTSSDSCSKSVLKFQFRRRLCAGILLQSINVIQLVVVSIAFLDSVRCFRCQHLITGTIGLLDLQVSKKKSTATRLMSAKKIQTDISVQSILPEGIPIQQYGIPVGAVILPGRCIESFHRECLMVFPDIKNLQFRGVEAEPNRINGDGSRTQKTIHLQSEVIASILDGDAPSLVEFIHQNDGKLLPGTRMKRDKQYKEACTPQGSTSSQLRSDSRFTFVELFAGVGGFRLGLEPIGGSCVLASELDEVACAFYRRHFGAGDDTQICPELVEGNVIDIVSEDFPEGGFDLLTAGFPCQPFSARGKKKGLNDDGHRGQMYQELVRILAEEQPPYFLFENVVGLVTMDGGRRVCGENSLSPDERNENYFFESGRTMETIVDTFRSCGYKVEWHVVNCKHFCPQHRERVYFFGSLLELDCPDMNWSSIYPTEAEPTQRPLLRDFLEQDYATSPEVQACELSERQWEMIQRKCGVHGDDVEPALTKLGLKIHEPSASTLISSYRTPASLNARLVTEEADGTLRDGRPLRPRFLTPVEFRRIMGFPDTFEVTAPSRLRRGTNQNDNDHKIVVDGHAYRVLGNAVVPAVIEAIGREILRLMEEVNKRSTKC